MAERAPVPGDTRTPLVGNRSLGNGRDPARLDYLVMPRLATLAERAWAADPAWASAPDPVKGQVLQRQGWTGFVKTMGQRVLPRLDLDGSNVAYRIAPPGLVLDEGRMLANHVLPRGTIRVAAFDRNGRRGAVATIASN
jgi:hexosaminidase